MRETIDFKIGTDGEVQMTYRGQVGKSCHGATQEIEQLLGVVQNKENTTDYYKDPPSKKVFETL